MRQGFCDILPADNGWVFVADDYHSPPYSSYDLALQAAMVYRRQKEADGKSIVLRFQTLKGSMSAIAPKGPMQAANAASRNRFRKSG